jgi:hypothetical protein
MLESNLQVRGANVRMCECWSRTCKSGVRDKWGQGGWLQRPLLEGAPTSALPVAARRWRPARTWATVHGQWRTRALQPADRPRPRPRHHHAWEPGVAARPRGWPGPGSGRCCSRRPRADGAHGTPCGARHVCTSSEVRARGGCWLVGSDTAGCCVRRHSGRDCCVPGQRHWTGGRCDHSTDRHVRESVMALAAGGSSLDGASGLGGGVPMIVAPRHSHLAQSAVGAGDRTRPSPPTQFVRSSRSGSGWVCEGCRTPGGGWLRGAA